MDERSSQDSAATHLDVAMLRELGIVYAFALDSNEPADLHDVFTEDAVWRHGADDMRVGRDAICRIPARLAAAYASTAHQITSQHVRLRTDGTALVHSLCVASHLTAQSSASGTIYEVMLRYRDECRRTAEGWRIVSRDLQTLWSRDYEVETAGGRRMPKTAGEHPTGSKEKHV